MEGVLLHKYGWIVGGEWTDNDLQQILIAGNRIKAYVNSVVSGKGQAWMDRYMGGTTFVHGSLRDLNGNSFSYVTGTTVHLDNGYGDYSTIVHEMGHVWDNNSVSSPICMSVTGKCASLDTSGYCDATICGGGNADLLTIANGGVPSGIRFKNGTSGISEPFLWNGYGDNGSAEYFAEAFRYMVMGESGKIPQSSTTDFMNTLITIEASGL